MSEPDIDEIILREEEEISCFGLETFTNSTLIKMVLSANFRSYTCTNTNLYVA